MWHCLVLLSSLEICWEPQHWPLLICLLLLCPYPFAPSCAHLFSSLSVPAHHICYICDCGALSFYSLGEAQWRWTGTGMGLGQRQGAAGPVTLCVCHRLCVCLCGAYAMPDSWVSDVWHRCFVPVAVLSSFICTGLSYYSQYIWDEETGAGGFLLLRFLVVLVIPPLRPEAKVFGGSSLWELTGVCAPPPVPPSQPPRAGASPAEQVLQAAFVCP